MTCLTLNQMCSYQGGFDENSWLWKTFCGSVVSVPPTIWGAGIGMAIGGPGGAVVGSIIGIVGGSALGAALC